MRRDAQARREVIIQAAADLFLERGFQVPLEDIATRAGVGRGTLYRNFADREALALAVFEKSFGPLEEVAARSDLTFRDAVLALVRTGASPRAIYARIAEDLAASTTTEPFVALGNRFSAALQPLLARGVAQGALRPDISIEQLSLAIRMLGGLLPTSKASKAADAQLEQALGIILAGLTPRP
ncbi:TetR/AcrR family transcriptional regulator [Sphingomonas sp.]|uniref:TetR/AcrR family transcriptional regulator n=1 Tax=Sphingomonas sp. TaxID=28214 RepID=UPI0035C858D8